jgi:hypothetical protein
MLSASKVTAYLIDHARCDAAGLWAGMPPLDDYNNLAFFVPFTGRFSRQPT